MHMEKTTYKLYDTFCYNGEEIALFHIQYLYDIVDKFIIIESRETFSGNIKPFLYSEQNIELFKPYISKIEFIIIDSIDFSDFENWKPEEWMYNKAYNSWYREEYQRNYVINYLKHIKEPYYIYCGDIDEIPNKYILQNIKNNSALYNTITNAIYFEMIFLYYNFKWKKIYNWYHAYITTSKCLENNTINRLRITKNKQNYIPNAGWHCSYFHSYENIKRKCESFSHTEFNNDIYKSQNHIIQCILEGKDLFKRGIVEDLKEFNETYMLPDGWEKLQNYILDIQQLA